MATAITDNTGAFPPQQPSSQNTQTSSTGGDPRSTSESLTSSLASTCLEDMSQLADNATALGSTSSLA